jgi:solute carrier family 10 (sodium/bile acid cotransporter), member 7
LKLSLDKLRSGLKNWRLHVLIQLTTFLIFPLLILPFKGFISSAESNEIWLGFLFLAALPSTVSSSVVMVSIAKGNLPAAVFNASISGLIGIAITPLWLGLFIETSAALPLTDVYMKLLIEILIPVIIGLSLQRYWGKYALHYARQLTLFDKSIILLIIYKSFAFSFLSGLFGKVEWLDFLLITIGVGILFYLVYYLISYVSGLLKFNREDRIAAQFCGTKKSLVHGTVFSSVLFPAGTLGGFILLPLMIFHAFQILVISVIAEKKRHEID